MTECNNLINIGQIAKPHGTSGKLKAKFFQIPKQFSQIYLEQIVYKVLEISFTSKMAIIELEGIDNLEKAEQLRNKNIFVQKSQFGNLAQEEFFIVDLIGLQVFDEQNKNIGEIYDFENIPNNPLLKINLQIGKKFLLPFNYEFIERIDINNKQIHLKNWQWLVI